MSTEQVPEVTVDESGLVPPSSPKAEWPKKLRTLTAVELDRLTIDGAGRFYWDGRPVAYEATQASSSEVKPVDTTDRSALDILDRAALDILDRRPPEASDSSASPEPVANSAAPSDKIAVVPVVADVRPAPPTRAVEVVERVHADKLRLTLSGWQSLGAILALLGFLVAASGIAAQGWVAANEWGCRVGWVKATCPLPPPAPKAPARTDIPA